MKTHWKKLDNPNYLGAYSLMDGEEKDLTLTIDKVVIEEVATDRGTDTCKVAYFKEDQKPMILNATNCKAISVIYGTPYIEDWSGKKITIYVARIKAFGDTVEALRIRKKKPQVQKPELDPHHHKWEAIKAGLNLNQCTLEDVKRNYSLSKNNEKLLLS